MRRNTINDEEFARQQQQRLYTESPTDIDDSPLGITQLNYDAAYAHQLQTEEYSKTSLPPAPSHPYFSSTQESNDGIYPTYCVDPDDPSVVSDAELAAQLEAEEKLQQRKRTSQRRPPPPARRPASSVTRTITSNNSSNHGFNPVVSAVSMLLRPFAAQHQASIRNDHTAAENLLNIDGDFGPEDYERLLELDTSTKANKLTEEQISTLPTEKYHRKANQSEEEMKCSICMEQFQPRQTLRRLTCFHVYHQDCIDPWLKENNICPICRIPPIK